jgi:hypothetical protein
MKALSIRQPWAWAILHAGKDIENRDWRTTFRGTIAVHAAKGMTLDEYAGFIDFFGQFSGADFPDPDQLARGCVVGLVDIVDCVSYYTSDWFQGDYGFVLANPRTLVKPIYCKGALGLWDVPAEIERQIKDEFVSTPTL